MPWESFDPEKAASAVELKKKGRLFRAAPTNWEFVYFEPPGAATGAVESSAALGLTRT